MDNVRHANNFGEQDIPFNEISEKTPILDDFQKKKRLVT